MRDEGSAFCVGVALAMVVFGLIICFTNHFNRRATFKDFVESRNCKITPYWRDGMYIKNSLCVMPDGTIISTETSYEKD